MHGVSLNYKEVLVALRKESVDRNVLLVNGGALSSVALRKESVDRNVFLTLTIRNVPMSLSARRAWIEIALMMRYIVLIPVALRKESVDRNTFFWLGFYV